MLYQMKELPVTFGNISKQILQSFIKSNATTIIIVFDLYFSPSIKDEEHILRGVGKHQPNHIRRKEQTRKTDMHID